MGPEIESLKATFSTNTNWSEWATLAVFVGLVGDILVILFFDLFDEDKAWKEIVLAGLASFVITAGVYGEYRYGGNATRAATQLQLYSEEKIAELNQRAEELRAKNLALQKEIMPRHVDVMLHALGPLKAFAGTKVFLDVVQDIEARRLMFDLAQLTGACKWKRFINQEPPLSLLPDGIEIVYCPDASDPAKHSQRAAEALSEYLNRPDVEVKNHVSVFSKPGPEWWPRGPDGHRPFNAPEDSVLVFIGLRPVGDGSREWFLPKP